jgi:hypothetical protein
VPAKQGLGLNEETSSASPREESAQPGEKCSVGWPQRRTGHLATEHCHLMAKHDDLDGEFTAFIAKESE